MGTDALPRLVGDIGGTNSRFAWQAQEGAALSNVASYRNDDHESLEAVVRRYLAEHAKVGPALAAVGIANPVTGDQVRMTNRDWSFSIEGMRRALGLQRLLVINDFTALALALPALSAKDLQPVGGGASVAGQPVALLGAGTGLGVSGLLPARDGHMVPLNGEGGHVTLAAANDAEAAVVAHLRQRFGHVSAERAVSGPGLENVYEAVCAIGGVPPRRLDAAGIGSEAVVGADPQCVQAVEHFFAFLGNVAGNLALTLGARGGVYIGGGIVPKLGDWILRSRFRERFEGKGRFQPYLVPIPAYVIRTESSPALLGAARALEEL